MYNIIEHEEHQYRRGTFIENENYKVDIEFFLEKVFVHLEVFKFSPSVMKRIEEDWKFLKELAWEEGFDHIYAYTPNPKFARKLGEFEHLDTAELFGQKREVIRWAL